jgi:hypothetical protein
LKFDIRLNEKSGPLFVVIWKKTDEDKSISQGMHEINPLKGANRSTLENISNLGSTLLINLSPEEIQLLRQLLVEDQLKPLFAARPADVGFGRAEELLDKLYEAMGSAEVECSAMVH